MPVIESLTIGSSSFMAIWDSYEKLRVFIEKDQYTVALDAIGDVTDSAACKALARSRLTKDPSEDIRQAIGHLQLSYEARFKAFEKEDSIERIPLLPFANEKLVYEEKAKSLRQAFQVALLISVLYHHLGKKEHSNEFLDNACFCLFPKESHKNIDRNCRISSLAFSDLSKRSHIAQELEALKWDKNDLTDSELEILWFMDGTYYMEMRGQFMIKYSYRIENITMNRFGLVASRGGGGGPNFIDVIDIDFQELFGSDWKSMVKKLKKGGFLKINNELNMTSYDDGFLLVHYKITNKGKNCITTNAL